MLSFVSFSFQAVSNAKLLNNYLKQLKTCVDANTKSPAFSSICGAFDANESLMDPL